MSGKYFGSWSSRDDVVQELIGSDYDHEKRVDVPRDSSAFPTEEQILFATYDYEQYEGSASLLFERDGKLYELAGSHCSCNGLEDMWDGGGDPITWDALALRIPKDGDTYWPGLFGASHECRSLMLALIRSRTAAAGLTELDREAKP